MIAYRRDWLDAIQIRETADYWADQGLISDEREQEIVAQYPVGFYSPNWFVRIGLALFGAVIIMALEGLLFLIFDAGLGSEVALLGLVIGIGLFVVLEFGLIDKAKHYRSGLDDITLYFGLGMVLFGVSQLFLEGLPFEVHLLCWCLFSGLAALRYADILLTLAAFACFRFEGIPGLSAELQSKLAGVRPETVGQAQRIPGMTPAAISLLLVQLAKRRRVA